MGICVELRPASPISKLSNAGRISTENTNHEFNTKRSNHFTDLGGEYLSEPAHQITSFLSFSC